jgi:hypothetical protein
LVTGFYVAPENYDPLTQHTPVVKEDLHFWAEVRLSSGNWLVIEPTPGYEVLGPKRSWTERAWAALLAAGWWFWEHILAVILCISVLAYGWWKRRELVDACAVAVLRLIPSRSWQSCVRRVLWLLESRGRWVGHPRPLSQTPATWLRATLHAGAAQPDALQQVTLMMEWSAYAADLAPPWPASDVHQVCWRVVDEWTLRRWRTVLGQNSNSVKVPTGLESYLTVPGEKVRE